ncbi:MAG: prolipoprotein diacylglyceryl transferase [Anaerolineaceae bacterium]
MNFFIDRYGVHIGSLFIHFYGVIIMLGVVAASLLARKRAKDKGLDPDRVWDMLTWLLIAGIIGARLWHIFTPTPSLVAAGVTTKYYLTHPIAMLSVWNGGLGIPGAVIGGALALYIYCRKQKQNFGVWVDIIAPGLLLAQAIGRWGNFINQEVYGAPTQLPWAIYIDELHRLPEFMDQAYYHPLFLYESLWNLAVMGLLLWMSKRFVQWLMDGDVFLFYLIGYPLGRFLLEFLRLDSAMVGGINANQTVMGVIAVASAVAIVLRHTLRKPKPVEESTEINPS